MSKEFLSHLSILLVNYDNFGTFLHGCEGKSEILDRVWDKQKGKKIFLPERRSREGKRIIFLPDCEFHTGSRISILPKQPCKRYILI